MELCAICLLSLGTDWIDWGGLHICKECETLDEGEKRVAHALTNRHPQVWLRKALSNPAFMRAITGTEQVLVNKE